MGGRSSRIISYDEACDRLGSEAVAAVEEGFRRLCARPRGLAPMDGTTFRRDVLSDLPLMPQKLQTMLFDAFDIEGRGELSLDAFMCGVAIIRVGTEDQRLRFLFRVYDVDECGFLTRDDLRRALRLVNSPKIPAKGEYDRFIDDMLDVADSRGDGLTLAEWKAWATDAASRTKDKGLLSWFEKLASHFVPDPAIAALEERLDPTRTRKSLASATKLTETEVGQLQAAIERLKRTSESGVVDRGVHTKVFGPHLSTHLTERLFAMFDPDGTGIANVGKMIEVLGLCCRGTFEEQVDLCFRLFDSSSSGALSAKDMTSVVSAVLMEMEDDVATADDAMPAPGPPKLVRRRSGTAEQRAELVESVYAELGLKTGSDVPFEIYQTWIRKHPEALNFLSVLREVTRVELGVRPNSWSEERDVIRACYKKFNPAAPGRPGDRWYLVPYGWWKEWCAYTGFDEDDLMGSKDAVSAGDDDSRERKEPGPIDNRELLIEDRPAHLKLHQFPDHHFKLIAPRVWLAFLGWYGGGAAVFRSVIAVPSDEAVAADKARRKAAGGAGGSAPSTKAAAAAASALAAGSKLELELYPPALRIRRLDKEGKVAERESEIVFSKVDTLETVRARACRLLFVEESKARLWQRPSKEDSWLPLVDLSMTIDDAQLIDQHEVLLELMQSDGSWPLAGHSAVKETDASAAKERVPGLVGLYNLGNTCFMNSALQCLSNTTPLLKYFLSDDWQYDVNVKNKMGTGGELAVVYANLMRDLWTSESKAVPPSRFKYVIGKHKPLFNGYEQQDSQELLNFVLSGLNEDLNRVTDKPYMEQPDSDGRPDAEVAEEWWVNHLSREQSIVSLFTGQFKSLLTCSKCGHESARFEPFMSLPLPLLEPTHRFVSVVFCFRDNKRKPMRISLQVNKAGTVGDLREAIVALRPGHYTPLPHDGMSAEEKRNCDPLARDKVDVFPEDIVFTRLGHHYIADTVMLDAAPVARISERDTIYVYHTHSLPAVRVEDVPLGVGVAVECRWRGDPKKMQYPGVVTAAHRSGRFDVRYDDGDCDLNMDPAVITQQQPMPVQITVVHRRLWRVSSYFLNPFQRVLFGVPYVLRLYPWKTSAYQLYWNVNNLSRRFIRRRRKASRVYGDGAARRVDVAAPREHDSGASDAEELEREPAAPSPPPLEHSESASRDVDEADGGAGGAATAVEDAGRKTPDQEDRPGIVDGAIDDWGFVLRRVNRTGTACSRCDWTKRCPGCPIDPDLEAVCLWDDETLAIDWDPALLDEALDRAESGALIVHPSVAENKRLEEQPLSLSQCMAAFQRSETIESFCGGCSRTPDGDVELRDQIKSLNLWRVPPVLVIQLKRFQFNQYSKRKLNNLVTFPVRGFDLSPFMAKDKVEQPPPDLTMWTFLGGLLAVGGDGSDDGGAAAAAGGAGGRSERKESSDSKEAGSKEANFNGIPLVLSREDVVYDLYGVVNHFGALGAGHYVAYAINPKDQKWHCFNDRHCNDMDESAVQSPYAYLLFYMRRDCKDADISELFPRVGIEKVDVSNIGRLSWREKVGQAFGDAARCSLQ